MSQDCRNKFLNDVRFALKEYDVSDTIISRITVLLDNYELSERTTEVVLKENWNVELIKNYTSAIIVDGKSKKTVAHYLRELKVFQEVFCTKRLDELATYDIRSYLAKRKLDGVSNRTLENIRAIILSFYGWLAAEEYIQKNPCLNIKPIKFTEEIKIPFTEVELDRLRSACKNIKERAMLETLLSSGVRVAELCDLNVEDINFSEKTVRVRHGKGDKERYTYINDLAKEHLLNYLNGRKEGAVFLTKKKTRFTEGGVRYLLHEIGDRAEVDDVHPHRCRRTFATSLASRGMQIQDIQKLMGHKNINTTMVYVAMSDLDTKYAYMKYA